MDLLAAVEARIGARPSLNSPPLVLAAFARNLRQAIIVLRAAHAALPWLEATRSPTINLGTLYLTEEFAVALIDTHVDLVMVESPEYMYSTTSWPFADIVDFTPGFSPTERRRPIVLNYPLSDADRLLLHPLFAHELGHASASHHSLVTTVEAAVTTAASFQAWLQGAVSAFVAVNKTANPALVAKGIRFILVRWIEELLCDALAVEVVGPGYLWSFAAFVLPTSYGQPFETHPPNTLRLHFILNQMETLGWNPYVTRIAPNCAIWLAKVAASATDALPPPYGDLRDLVMAHRDRIHAEAGQVVGGARLNPMDASGASKTTAELLGDLILPVGLEQPLPARSIVLGGWERALADHGDHPKGLVEALLDTRLQELVGKAVEMTTVATAWGRTP